MAEVTALAIAPDGRWIAGADKGAIRIRSIKTGRQIAEQKVPYAPTWLAIAPNGRWLVYDCGEEVRRWRLGPDGNDESLVEEAGTVVAAVLPPGVPWFVTAGSDRVIRLWDRADGAERLALTGHSELITALAVAPDGSWLVSAGVDRTIRVWDIALRHPSEEPTEAVPSIAALTLSPDGRCLAVADNVNRVEFVDPVSGHQVLPPLESTDGIDLPVEAISWAGNRIATVRDDKICVRNRKSGRWVESQWSGVLAIADGGDWFAVSGESLVQLRELQTGELLTTLSRHDGHVVALAIAQDNSRLAVAIEAGAARDGQRAVAMIEIWDLATKTVITRIKRVAAPSSLIFSPNGGWIISAGESGDIEIFSAVTGRRRAGLVSHSGAVTAMATSLDGNWLASAGEDRSILVWSLQTHRPVAVMRLEQRVSTCTWTRSGDALIVGGSTGLCRFSFRHPDGGPGR